jgi:hypothetical protein
MFIRALETVANRSLVQGIDPLVKPGTFLGDYSDGWKVLLSMLVYSLLKLRWNTDMSPLDLLSRAGHIVFPSSLIAQEHPDELWRNWAHEELHRQWIQEKRPNDPDTRVLELLYNDLMKFAGRIMLEEGIVNELASIGIRARTLRDMLKQGVRPYYGQLKAEEFWAHLVEPPRPTGPTHLIQRTFMKVLQESETKSPKLYIRLLDALQTMKRMRRIAEEEADLDMAALKATGERGATISSPIEVLIRGTAGMVAALVGQLRTLIQVLQKHVALPVPAKEAVRSLHRIYCAA